VLVEPCNDVAFTGAGLKYPLACAVDTHLIDDGGGSWKKFEVKHF
jgi:hypothetical protein